MTTTVGLDLGGTKILGALVSDDGTVIAEHRVATPAHADALVAALVAVTRELGDAPAVGVGAAGLVDGDGYVRYGPNVPAFRNLPLRTRLSHALGVPVVVDNDANAAAWGEVVHGAGRGYSDVLVVTLGTGVGGGIVSGGRLLRGAHGFAAEVGHFQVTADGPDCACGQRGHWEALASGRALGRLARSYAERGEARAIVELAGGRPGAVTGVHVTDAALGGDAEAREIVAEFADDVAVGLAALVNILDPAIVVLGGGLVVLGEFLLDPVRSAVAQRIEAADARPEIPIVAAVLGERAGAVGAACLAREALTDA